LITSAILRSEGTDLAVIESEKMRSATWRWRPKAYGCSGAFRIAKTLSMRIGERVVLIVDSGTARMDNRKVKAHFGGKPKMLDCR